MSKTAVAVSTHWAKEDFLPFYRNTVDNAEV